MHKKLFYIWLIFLSLLNIPAIQAITGDSAIDSVYSEGIKEIKAGQLARAIELFEQVEKTAPGYKDVHEQLITGYKYLGILKYEQYKYEEAITSWKKALTFDPENEEIKAYILRSIREVKVLKNIDIDSSDYVVHQQEPKETVTDTIRIYLPDKQLAADRIVPGKRQKYSSPLTAGLTFGGSSRTDPGETVNKNGMTVSGMLSISPRFTRFGITGRYEYNRYAYNDDAIYTVDKQYLSVSGLSVSLRCRLFTWHNSSWYTFGGIGRYELTKYDNSLSTAYQFSTRNKTAYNTGIGVRFSHGFVSSGVELRYLRFSSEEISDMLFLSVGIYIG